MKVLIKHPSTKKFDDDFFPCESKLINCFCGGDDKESELIDDYSNQIMIWCDKCGGRFFICARCSKTKKTEKEEVVTEFQLMKVKAILNRQIYSFEWNEKLFKNHFEELLKIPFHEERNILKFSEKYSLKFLRHKDKDYFAEILENDSYFLWEYAIKCDDYNTENTIIKNKGLDMSHDSIMIFAKCECEICGFKKICCYDGD